MLEDPITSVTAREILDSRGQPTLEVEIGLASGVRAFAPAPSGASKGRFEAVEKRDPDRLFGKGVRSAIAVVQNELSPLLVGQNVFDQQRIDHVMLDFDGTDDKRNTGGNSLCATSLAVAKAAALSMKIPLWRYLGGAFASKLPVPMVNLINGGAHADTEMRIQEFMIVPYGASSFAEALQQAAEIFRALGEILRQHGFTTGLGDEGGYAPAIAEHRTVLDALVQAITQTGLHPSRDPEHGDGVALALDCAATEFYQHHRYHLSPQQKLDSDQMIAFFQDLTQTYPIAMIEDGLAEEDWSGWQRLTATLGGTIGLVGDDLFTTHPQRIAKGIATHSANAVLIKPNQIGTLTQTAQTVSLASQAGYGCVMSHRSGETEDTTIADLAVAFDCGLIKTGSVARGERTAKYNRLLRIGTELDCPVFAGASVLKPQGQTLA